MFEQLYEPQKKPQVSTAMTLGILAAYLVGAFGGFCLFIILGDRTFGIQIVTAITYTYFAFWYVFFPTRGLLEKYSLRNKTVQQQIPSLLAIHIAFLIMIFLGQTIWFAIKPHLSRYWATDRGAGTPYAWVMIGSSVVFFFTQVLISRRILSRSGDEARSGYLRIMSKKDGIIGVSDHGGWAVLVTVAPDGTLLDRRRVELVGEGLPKLPHHSEGQRLRSRRPWS